MQKGGAVYILTNKNKTTLYIGVTNDLQRRIYEHQNGLNPNSFVAKYNLFQLVYYEGFHSIEEAIMREKQLKGWTRKKKEVLIFSTNESWKDLTEEIMSW
ncbi:GIY-YIG nuclease family protein [Aquiflexum sp. LQ15W]|uniref:GIY-YIG nuclease family protein n=1 Tax=Cognataquiflexum nitidum TaxID=2922272 RepID=UPI001F13DF85|nr:GIY-YIG nuclease family protein [Cognataquiflexum nitidum]MCH6200313.1 GIY-YIG nuclease family protein [Cognataquiflexum nitidum]MCH6200314.1 GIY-YIG nuclease family protein [Cognataquiflexum nitidum]